MQADDRELVEIFLSKNVYKSTQDKINSYVLKHIIQKYIRIYMTDEEMQKILLDNGFNNAGGESWFCGKVKPEILIKYYGSTYRKRATIKQVTSKYMIVRER